MQQFSVGEHKPAIPGVVAFSRRIGIPVTLENR